MPHRLIAFSRVCSAQLLSRVVLGGGLLQSWQSGGTVGRTVGQRFLLDRIALPCGFGAVSEEQWCVVLGSRSDYRF